MEGSNYFITSFTLRNSSELKVNCFTSITKNIMKLNVASCIISHIENVDMFDILDTIQYEDGSKVKFVYVINNVNKFIDLSLVNSIKSI